MLRDVRLRLLPNVLNCVRWSQDGQVAIVACEDVVVLIPKNGLTGGKRLQQFHHSRVNLRGLIIKTAEEEIDPGDAEWYSLGEEQGPGYAKQAEWSPLGVDSCSRCVLAVSTTNHRLWLFVPGLEPWVDWRVKFDMAVKIREFKDWPEDDKVVFPEVVRQRLRGRSMSWSPACMGLAGKRWGESLLAVANDWGEITLLRVTSEGFEIKKSFKAVPLSELTFGNKEATFVKCLAWSRWATTEDGKSGTALLAYAHKGKVWLSRIGIFVGENGLVVTTMGEGPKIVGEAWSPKHMIFAVSFAQEEISGYTIMAYAIQRCVRIIALDKDLNSGAVREFGNGFIEVVTGLCFTPSSTKDSTILQVVTVEGRTQSVEYKPVIDSDEDVTMIGSSEDIQCNDITMTDELPPMPGDKDEEELRAIARRWTSLLSERKQDYMGEHDLPAALCRVYGIAASPLGGIVVAACSFHPSDSLQYITASKEATKLIFGAHQGSGSIWDRRGFLGDDDGFPDPRWIPSEGVFLEALAAEKGDSAVEEMKDALRKYGSGVFGLDKALETDLDSEDSLANFMFRDRVLNSIRYLYSLQLLADRNSLAVQPPGRESPEILARVVVGILRFSRNEKTRWSTLSRRILYSIASVGVLGFFGSREVLELCRKAFEWLAENPLPSRPIAPAAESSGTNPINIEVSGSNSTDNNPSQQNVFETELSLIRKRFEDLEIVLTGKDDGSNIVRESEFVSKFERCILCNEEIKWNDISIAECKEGHRFSRCAVTFLPLWKEEGAVECLLCERVVLGRGFVSDDEMELVERGWKKGGEEENRKEKSLAEVVVGAWDVCIHCGGRYWERGRKEMQEEAQDDGGQ
ncbi:hypothetical protein RUND412_005290 [Rhizina undulata]